MCNKLVFFPTTDDDYICIPCPPGKRKKSCTALLFPELLRLFWLFNLAFPIGSNSRLKTQKDVAQRDSVFLWLQQRCEKSHVSGQFGMEREQTMEDDFKYSQHSLSVCLLWSLVEAYWKKEKHGATCDLNWQNVHPLQRHRYAQTWEVTQERGCWSRYRGACACPSATQKPPKKRQAGPLAKLCASSVMLLPLRKHTMQAVGAGTGIEWFHSCL